MAIYELDGIALNCPRTTATIVETAAVIGKVRPKADVSVWFGAVLHMTTSSSRSVKARMRRRTGIFHTDPDFPLTVGKNCTIGYNVISKNGCTIEDGALIGMGAIVMNGRDRQGLCRRRGRGGARGQGVWRQARW